MTPYIKTRPLEVGRRENYLCHHASGLKYLWFDHRDMDNMPLVTFQRCLQVQVQFYFSTLLMIYFSV